MLVSSLLFAVAAAGCTQCVAAHPDAPVIPVMAAKAEEKAMPIELHEIGTGDAYSTVSIESQVAGIVSAVHYTRGQFVKKGDLLVSLDDRPFVAALEVARANLAKDRANAQLVSVEAERYKEPGRERLALSHEPLLAPHAKGIEQNP